MKAIKNYLWIVCIILISRNIFALKDLVVKFGYCNYDSTQITLITPEIAYTGNVCISVASDGLLETMCGYLAPGVNVINAQINCIPKKLYVVHWEMEFEIIKMVESVLMLPMSKSSILCRTWIVNPASFIRISTDKAVRIELESDVCVKTYATKIIFDAADIAYQEIDPSNSMIDSSVSYTYNASNPLHNRDDYFITVNPGSWFYYLTPVFSHSSLAIPLPLSTTLFCSPSNSLCNAKGSVAAIAELRDGYTIASPATGVTEDEITGLAAYGYTEYVLSPLEIMNNRQLRYSKKSYVPAPAVNPNPTIKKIQLCIWGSTKMDGQKHIWLQQLEYLDRTKFDFTWVVSGMNKRDRNSIVEKYFASHNHVKVVASPVEHPLSVEQLMQVPHDGSSSAWIVWNNKVENLFRYCIQRFKVANMSLADVSPIWVRETLERIVKHMLDERCDVIVYGNSKGYSGDVLITTVARFLGIPTVAELVALYPDPAIVPDVFIGPSHFALHHSSVEALISEANVPKLVIISPGVNMNAVIAMQQKPLKLMHDDDEFVVGFIGRLSVDKSVGLFILAAAEWMERMKIEHPGRRILFRVIGDGPLLTHLKDLVVMLGLQEVVEFLGWLSGDGYLTALNSIDVLVNPSQVNETFCITNIEAMAMSIPVVTFGVGGIGEYIDYDVLTAARSPHPRYFSIARNALLLNEASPEAISSALMYLYEDAGLRVSLGAAGHAIVAASFTTELQMAQYESVYLELVSSKLKD